MNKYNSCFPTKRYKYHTCYMPTSMNLHERLQLSHLMMLLEARDDFLIQTFGQKLVDKITDENQRGMPMPTDLTTTLKAADSTPPANKIVAWFVANDPIQGKGSQWMIVQYIRGNYQLEDIDQVKHSLTEFVRVRTQLTVKDLGQYKTLQALNDALEPFQDKKVMSNRQARKSMEIDPAIKPQLNIILDDGDILIAVPTTHEASKYLASTDFMGSLTDYRAANWCTARTEPHYYQSHTARGPLYFIFIKSGPDAGKYQFHFETKQFHTSANSRIPNLRGWLARNEPIRQAFEAKAAEHGILEFLSPEAMKTYRQQYIDRGSIVQLAADDKATIMFLPDTQQNLHVYLMGGSGERSYSRWTGKPTKVHRGRVTGGTIYIELADHTVFTYKLGYSSVLYNDAKPYPVKNLMNKVPIFKELVTTLMQEAGVDSTDQTDPAVQEMVASGAAKQIFTSDALTVWWVDSAKSFQKYFNVQGPSLQRFYANPPLNEKAGIMLLDVGTTLASYRLGDKEVYLLDTDTLTDTTTGWVSVDSDPITKFMVEYPATVPIIKKYADHYGYYPLMSDKAKAKRMEELEEQGVITIIKKDSPSVIQLKTADSADLVRPLIVMNYYTRSADVKQVLAKEIARGPVYLIQGTIILSSALGGTFQINSNNGTAAVSTKMVFERFPALRTILKDQLVSAGITMGEDVPLEDVVTGLTQTSAITPLQANPLVIGIKTVTGARWFVEHHAGDKAKPQTDVRWGEGGIITPYDKVFTWEGAREGTAPIDGTKAFGFLGKGGVPLILAVKRAHGGNNISLNLYTSFGTSGRQNKDITTTQGVVAFMQKYPEVLRAIVPALEGVESDAVQELAALSGGSQADPFSQTTSAITGIMKALKASGDGKSQALSELNADKFNKGCYNAAAYLKQYAGQFTVEQAKSTADRIINVMKFTSKESLRTMPKELAEWLKYATQLTAEEAESIVRKHPVFIGALRRPSLQLMRNIYAAGNSANIEAARQFAHLDPVDEETLDQEIFANRVMEPLGVNYNNVVQQVEEHERRYGVRSTMSEKLIYMRNVPSNKVLDYVRGYGNANKIRDFVYPPEAAVIANYTTNPHLATAKGSNGIKFSRKTAMMRAATKYVRQHGSMTGFVYTPPAPVQLPRVGPAPRVSNQQPAARREPAPVQAQPQTPRQGAAAGFATKAAHARHIIDNRTPEDTRPSLIRRLIDEVGLTPAGAATYYYNLTRAAVREGDETADLFMTTLRSLLY